MNIVLIIICVFLSATAQLLLKKGVGAFNFLESSQGFFSTVWHVLFNPYILQGICMFVLSLGVWLTVLSKVNLSYAYPFASLGYIVVAVAAYLIFDEPLTVRKIVGTLVICAGVGILAGSQG